MRRENKIYIIYVYPYTTYMIMSVCNETNENKTNLNFSSA